MNLNRQTFLKAGALACCYLTVPTMTSLNNEKSENGRNSNTVPLVLPKEKVCRYHEPPVGVDYATNPSVFAQILGGTLPAAALKETTNLFSFVDRSPRAPFHALVIPKRRIPTIYDLRTSSGISESSEHKKTTNDQNHDLALLDEMKQMAHDLLETYQPDAYRQNDFILCFHVPPFNSVDHLHLHVLAPASQMSWPFLYGKYRTGTRWCTSWDSVRQRLQKGLPAVPFPYWKSFWAN